MLVYLIRKERIFPLTLPNVISGSYWLTDEDEKGNTRQLFSVEEKDGTWHLFSNSTNRILNQDGNVIPEIILKNAGFYAAQSENENAILYFTENQTFTQYSLNKEECSFIIGKSPECTIQYSVGVVSDKNTFLSLKNGIWTVQDNKSNFGTYVNGVRIGQKNLSYGDVIFIMGLKIIVLKTSILISAAFPNIQFSTDILSPFEYVADKIEEQEDALVELYQENDYFYRSPRFKTVIEKEVMTIDSPPTKQNQEKVPLIMTIGPMLTMGMMSMMTLYTSIERVLSKNASFQEALPSIVIGLAMLGSMLVWPMINNRYQEKQKIKYEKERQEKYRKYIDEKSTAVDYAMKKQRQILTENNINLLDCENIILKKERQLWERKVEHKDFLEVRLGMGTVPLSIDIKYPEEHFTMEEDDLRDILNLLVGKSKDIQNVPITVSLTDKFITGVVGKREETYEFMKQILLQLVTFHSYEDLKLVFFLNPTTKEKWEWVKLLPHVWSDEKQIRYYASDYDEMRYISSVLEKEFEYRKEAASKNLDYKSFSPYYILITDDYRLAKNVYIIVEALKQKTNIGFNVMVINEELQTLPNECTTFINVSNKKGGVFESELSSDRQKEFNVDEYPVLKVEECARALANIPIKFTKEIYSLPNVYTFLEMYEVGKVEQLNSLNRWHRNSTTNTLQAPVGLDSHGMLLKLDIHEKAHGPHGLIAGMTGSGKSEFIITYILSLAVNYHPDDVSFILIDYKGGGLAGAFKNPESNIVLPHLAGTITNLDTAEMNRSLVSIQSELRRRQQIFNETRAMLNEGTIDIYKYQKFYHDGVVKEPISHLLIICDEFAELKANQPDFMDQLISTARIGRSLGVHLILATQKPSGVVNDQIWSNSRFRICLKVQEKSDSQDMIKTPLAAELKQTGRFYLQVGYNEYFELGQSAWCGAPYIPTEKMKKKIDDSLEIINDIGAIVKEVEPAKKQGIVVGEQLPSIVRYLSEIAKIENIHVRQLWLDKIPAYIEISQLIKKYHYTPEEGILEPVIGEYDDPFNQYQGLLTLPLTNTIIYGATGSGKSLLLSTILYSSITTYTPEDVNFYILDFASESLKMYAKAPHVGDILFINDNEKIDNLFKILLKEIEIRKKLFVDYNGDYDFYSKHSPVKIPMYTILINNYEAFNETYSKYEDVMLQLTREGTKYGISFILTASASNAVRYRLSQNFKQKIALQLNDENDYYSIFGRNKTVLPANYEGRGLVRLNDVYEFQTAHVCKIDALNETVNQTCMELNATYKVHAKKIPVLPNVVTIEDVLPGLKSMQQVPIGIEKESLQIATYDFYKNFVTRIFMNDFNNFSRFFHPFVQILSKLNPVAITFLTEEDIEVSPALKITDFAEYFKKEEEKIDAYLSHTLNYPYQIVFVNRIDKLTEKMTIEQKKNISNFFVKARKSKHYTFIFIDTVDNYKKVDYEDWYRALVQPNQGIWIGNGIADQFLLKVGKITKEMYQEIGSNFGYIVINGVATLVKLLEGESHEK